MYKKRTIIVSNRLPIRIEKTDGELKFIQSEGGLATGLGSIYKRDNNIWIGWPGYIPECEEEKKIIREQLAELNLIPVFLTPEQIEGYYEGFSNEVLWPIFHYRLSYAIYKQENWQYYKEVNQAFCDAVWAEQPNDKDEIWIHDYQLMLLPKLIRQGDANISIGYFQHIPFPPDEIFRCIPWRNELLEGVLGADLIAFHTYNDTQHFLNAGTHILGLTIKNNCLQIGDRSVYVEVYPMGIDYDKFSALAESPDVQTRARCIKEHYQNRKIILSIDRLDYSKGILERLYAFENFLIKYPQYSNQVVLYMLVVPSRDTVPQYKRLRDEIDRLVGHINAVYGTNEWTPIAYYYNTYPVEELSALYAAADVCLVTSLRDGMNLVCKEYVASKENEQGVLILSELAGASKELLDAIQVNPNAIDEISNAIVQAIKMPEEEQRKRMDANIAIVKKFNINHWVRLFFNRLREIKHIQKNEMSRKVREGVREMIFNQYQNSQKRLFFLDYDGTLIGFHKDADDAAPTTSLYRILEKLQSDNENQIVIISGRPRETLTRWFGDKDYYLVAEHGAWTNYPAHTWTHRPQLSNRWKIPVKHIMTKFANITAGASVEEKSYSLAWHYRKAQQGLGQLRSQELVDSLRYLIPQHGLQLLQGDKVIEVKNGEVNKGLAALEIVNHYKPDFIFAMGDDVTDEDMFIELPSSALTVKVGNKKSEAHFYVENQEDAVNLVHYFVEKIESTQRIKSSPQTIRI
ncbi:bifunctional alpha,alpha-trehalose-phosphate synthase (UDP-forming)/trehalose-phosphatase [Sphingobacterium gobiense]|uniref:Glucosylglycerol-phosphate synthase n=1 Tax=Sphingobacterium gobiense TaxID=1382456 RepID=A0A2S9JW77_9SPHI|nr:bifunctional alpha,alpha-trehalose-phosphate synthase (UDP-forming)/trehalose-phosphatase [Sphingobacterium gobiense]PRD57510.1 bifunctional alpha,alpha-trehalose-phosphate synthase (UDP-forming)/trehalose-phosphatase [Sphingobacterium gobiense]